VDGISLHRVPITRKDKEEERENSSDDTVRGWASAILEVKRNFVILLGLRNDAIRGRTSPILVVNGDLRLSGGGVGSDVGSEGVHLFGGCGLRSLGGDRECGEVGSNCRRKTETAAEETFV